MNLDGISNPVVFTSKYSDSNDTGSGSLNMTGELGSFVFIRGIITGYNLPSDFNYFLDYNVAVTNITSTNVSFQIYSLRNLSQSCYISIKFYYLIYNKNFYKPLQTAPSSISFSEKQIKTNIQIQENFLSLLLRLCWSLAFSFLTVLLL